MLNVLLTTAMFVGGSVAFILDNTIPGKGSGSVLSFFSTELKLGSEFQVGTDINKCRKAEQAGGGGCKSTLVWKCLKQPLGTQMWLFEDLLGLNCLTRLATEALKIIRMDFAISIKIQKLTSSSCLSCSYSVLT